MSSLPRITALHALLLELLERAGPTGQYGWALIQQSNGQLKLGSVYVVLQRLEEKLLIKSYLPEASLDDAGPRRRYYCLTDLGLRALKLYRELDAVCKRHQEESI
jgi:DNA-binding PadR family transcriptional regulator